MRLTKRETVIAANGVREWLRRLEDSQRWLGSQLTKRGAKGVQRAIDDGYRLLIRLEKS